MSTKILRTAVLAAAIGLPGAAMAAEWDAACVCKWPNRPALTAFVIVTAENIDKVKQTMAADGLKTSTEHVFKASACANKQLCEGLKVANQPDGEPVTGSFKLFVRGVAGDLDASKLQPGGRIRFTGEPK